MTQEHLNTAIGIILNSLLKEDAILSFRQPLLAEQYLALLTLLDLLVGINRAVEATIYGSSNLK